MNAQDQSLFDGMLDDLRVAKRRNDSYFKMLTDNVSQSLLDEAYVSEQSYRLQCKVFLNTWMDYITLPPSE